jgi:hypothetical protein
LGGAELEKGRVSNAMSKKIVIVDDEKVGEWSWFNLTLHIDFDNVKQRDIFLELAREHGASLSFLEAPVVDDTQ